MERIPFRRTRQICTVASILWSSFVSAAPRNVTIDDEHGDELSGARPTYISATPIWALGSSCGGCNNKPDPNRSFRGTWHDTTFLPGNDPVGLEIRFTGTAVYAFFILGWDVYTNTRLDIQLDGANVGSYTQPPSSPNGEDYSYNVPVYANSNVGAGQHTLRIMAKTDSSTFETLLFDYAVYTVDEPDNSTPQVIRPGTTVTPNQGASSSLVSSSLASPFPVRPLPSSGLQGLQMPSALSLAIDPPSVSQSLPGQTLALDHPSSPDTPPSSTTPPTSTTPPSSTTASSSDTPSSPTISSSSASSRLDSAVLAAIIIGAVLAVSAVAALCYFCRRRRRRIFGFDERSIATFMNNELRSGSGSQSQPHWTRFGNLEKSRDLASNDRCSSTAPLHSPAGEFNSLIGKRERPASDSSTYDSGSTVSDADSRWRHEIDRLAGEDFVSVNSLSAQASTRLGSSTAEGEMIIVSLNGHEANVRQSEGVGHQSLPVSAAGSGSTVANMSDPRPWIAYAQEELGSQRAEDKSLVVTVTNLNVPPPQYVR